jgi:hypothetical protein
VISAREARWGHVTAAFEGWAWRVGWVLVLAGWTWIAYAAGGAMQGGLSLHTISNANWCATLLHEAVSEGERSAALHASRSGAVEAFLRGGERGEVVVSAEVGP